MGWGDDLSDGIAIISRLGVLAVGDVVNLKSGSPLMTVMKLGEDGEVDVVWFAPHGTNRAKFPIACLVRGEPSSEVLEK